MKKNMGSVDRMARAAVAVVLVIAAAVFGFGSVGGIIALLVAAVMAATAAVGTCPAYIPFGITTCGRPVHH
jgi:hypothetical protein